QSQDDADLIEGDLGQQRLKARPALGAGAAVALVFVDDGDNVAGPAQPDGPLRQGILPLGGLAVVEDLLGRGLADIDDGAAVEVMGLDLGTERARPRERWRGRGSGISG